MKQISKVKKVFILCFMMMVIFSWTTPAYADMGPKAKLVIHVQNPPKELYYLDILTKDISEYDNIREEVRPTLNQDMVKLLYSYENEDWKPGLAEGTHVPMFGNLVGEQDGDEMVHTFSYFGVPDTYRIIIVTESGKVSVSDDYTRHALQSRVTYDYSNGKITVTPIWISYSIQFLTTCIPTLIIEGIILLLFGFKLKDNWKPFLLINVVTQVVLTLIVGVSLIKNGTTAAYSMQFPVEIAILITETILFRKFLTGKSNGRRCIYGIVANIASWAIGFFLIRYQFELLTKFL